MGTWLAGVASSDTGCSPPAPTSALSICTSSSILLANSIQKTRTKIKENNDHHRRNEGAHTPQQPTEEASSIACCPEQNAPGSRFTPRPRAEQSPAAPPPGRYRTQSAPSLTRGLLWHSQRLGNVPSQPQGPWPLSPVTPATNQLGGISGPRLWELGFGEQRVQPWKCGESHAGWEINTRVFGSSASLGWNGEGPGRCGGRQVSAEGWTGQQVASMSPGQGWPPTMLASGLAPQAGSSLLMGEGNTVSGSTNPLRSIRLGGRGPQSTAQQLVIILLWL